MATARHPVRPQFTISASCRSASKLVWKEEPFRKNVSQCTKNDGKLLGLTISFSSSDVENASSNEGHRSPLRFEAAVYVMKAFTTLNSRNTNTSLLYGPKVIGCEASLALQFSPSGKWLVSASKRAVEIFRVEDEVRVTQIFRCVRWSNSLRGR